MSFSDWITIVSILTAVGFAVIKYDELQILRLKRFWRYFWLPLVALILSGIAAYFHTNPHPSWLNSLWVWNTWWTLPSGFWPIAWIMLFVLITSICWYYFVRQPPSQQILDLYEDIIEVYEPAKFSALFRKYDRFFFENIRSDRWLSYEQILRLPKFWQLAPIHFREVLVEMMRDHGNRFFEMDRSIATTILRVQLANNDTQLMKELERQPGEIQETPILSFFLGTAEAIEGFRSRNILIPTIKDVTTDYLQSHRFIEGDRAMMILRPIDGLVEIPSNKLIIFYYINFIHWYWLHVIRTKAGVSGFYQYSFWTDLILKQAPILTTDVVEGGGQPNHYLQAVTQMMRNIGDWISAIENSYEEEEDEDEDEDEEPGEDDEETTNDNGNDEGDSDLQWAFEHFIELRLWILRTISDKHMPKVLRRWYVSEVAEVMKDLVKAHVLFANDFHPEIILRDKHLPDDLVVDAIEEFTDDDYPGPEQASPTFRWITEIIGRWRAGVE